jgi:Beta-lactamase enzyme family/ORF 12 gene product N-terminal
MVCMRRFCALLLGVLVLLGPAVAAPAAAASGPVTVNRPHDAAVVAPDTPAGRQVTWLLDASGRLPLDEPEVRAHVTAAFLAVVPVSALNAALASVAGGARLTLLRYEAQPDQGARFLVTGNAGTWLGGISVDAAGLVASLVFSPYVDAPTTWGEVDRRLAGVAPRVSMLAARVDPRTGRCRPVHGVAADTPRPLGSAFKLYVLGALAEQVRAGRASWNEHLAIRDDWKSLPSGVLQNLPAGTELTLQQYAAYMIAVSDNTATDHLIHRLGRHTVEVQQIRFGVRQPWRNLPFLTTRELFILKLTSYPALLDAYRRLPAPLRPAYLATHVDARPLPSLDDATTWTAPRGIGSVEWFASPSDICRAYAGLARQAAAPRLTAVGTVLSRNDGGLWLDTDRWSTTWYKGGSEPGVLTLNYLARLGGGDTYVVSAMVNDPSHSIPEATAVPELQALVRGVFTLMTTP